MIINCEYCQQPFTTDKSDRRFCSRGHKEYARKKNQGGCWKPRSNPTKVNFVVARDNWVCQLCGDPVDANLKYPHPFSFSIDHIVPRALGGTHEVNNLQTSHLQCNVTKGGVVG